MPVNFFWSSSPNLLGHLVHTFIASHCPVDPLPFGYLLSLIINAGFFCRCDRRHPRCPHSLLSWFLHMFFFHFSLPSALPHPSACNASARHFIYKPYHGLVIQLRPLCELVSPSSWYQFTFWTFDQLSYHGTQKETWCCFQSKHCYSVWIIEFYYYGATLLMPGVSAVPEVAPLKGLLNHLSLSTMRLKKRLYLLFSYVFNLTIY